MMLSPFIIENQLQEIEGVEMGTLVKLNGQLILVAETNMSTEAITHHINGIEFDRIIITDIPRDPRHNSKIDYPKLEDIIPLLL